MHRGQVIDEVIDDSDEDGLDQLSVLLPARSSQGGSRRLANNAPAKRMDKGKGRALPNEIIELSSDSSDQDLNYGVTSSNTRIQLPGSSQIQESLHSVDHNNQYSGYSQKNGFLERIPGNASPILSKSTLAATTIPPNSSDAISIQQPEASGSSSIPPTDSILASVLQIIPNVAPDHVTELISELSNNLDPTRQGPQFLEHILHNIFENPDYPKVNKAKLKRKHEDEEAESSQNKKVKIDYESTDRQIPNSANYSKMAELYIGIRFPRLPKNHITKTLRAHNGLYAPAFISLMKIERDGNFSQLHMNKKPRRAYSKDILPCPEFEAEHAWCLSWLEGKTTPFKESKKARVEDVPESEACEDGSGIECGCCFSEYTIETMVQCPEGHLFCKSCMFSFSKERLGQRISRIKCMHQSNCEMEIPFSQLKLCFPPSLVLLYERVTQSAEIAAAGLSNLEECPFCEFKCVIENEDERLFTCLDETCGVVSCRSCKKPDHLPKTCVEAEKDNVLNAQHSIEEAMTNALMRSCPKCQKSFIKSDGCNKIICVSCSAMSCYVCRKEITGYDHFDQGPRALLEASFTAPKKCPLYETITTDQRHTEEIRQARQARIEQLRQEDPDVDVSQIKVDDPVTTPQRNQLLQPQNVIGRPQYPNVPVGAAQQRAPMHYQPAVGHPHIPGGIAMMGGQNYPRYHQLPPVAPPQPPQYPPQFVFGAGVDHQFYQPPQYNHLMQPQLPPAYPGALNLPNPFGEAEAARLPRRQHRHRGPANRHR